jgi:hypothetical protein
MFVLKGGFLGGTRTSLLGNVWQAVAQVLAATDRDVLLLSMERTDDEIEEYLRGHVGSGQARIRPSAWTRRTGDEG